MIRKKISNEAFVDSFRSNIKYSNFIKNIHPFIKLAILVSIAIINVIMKNYILGFAFCGLFYLIAFASESFKKFNKLFLKVVVLILLFIIVIRQITFDGTIKMFSIFGWVWTWEALEAALQVGVPLLVFSGAIILFFNITPMRDLMFVLQRQGLSHTITFIMLSSIQTVIDLNKSANRIFESQKSRGIETDGNIMTRIKAFFPILSPLLLSAISSTEEKTVSMDARAFSFPTKKTSIRTLEVVRSWEKVLVALLLLLIMILAVYKFLN